MTTIIIDEKTKAIYADSQATETETQTTSSVVKKVNEYKKVTLDQDYIKVYYISKKIGWIFAVGCMNMLNSCVSLSKKNNEFTLPDISKGYNDVTIVNVVCGVGNKFDIMEYEPRTKKVYKFFTKNFWKNNWHRLGDNGILFYGSGSRHANGAYQICKDPIQAIIAASNCDMYTNANVKVHKLED